MDSLRRVILRGPPDPTRLKLTANQSIERGPIETLGPTPTERWPASPGPIPTLRPSSGRGRATRGRSRAHRLAPFFGVQSGFVTGAMVSVSGALPGRAEQLASIESSLAARAGRALLF